MTRSMTKAQQKIVQHLADAIVEADSGPDEDRDALYMAEDVADTPTFRDLIAELEQGRRAAAALRLMVMRHHDAVDWRACDVCAAGVRALEHKA